VPFVRLTGRVRGRGRGGGSMSKLPLVLRELHRAETSLARDRRLAEVGAQAAQP
jgi:hypothetical protein